MSRRSTWCVLALLTVGCRPEVTILTGSQRSDLVVLGFTRLPDGAGDHSPCGLAWSSGPLDANDFPVQAPPDLELIIARVDQPFTSLRAALRGEAALTVPWNEDRDGQPVRLPALADGVITPGLHCEPCGNGVSDDFKACDDGNLADDDGCTNLCTIAEGYACPLAGPCTIWCGNGAIDRDRGEQCDRTDLDGATCATVTGAPAASGALACTPDCHLDRRGCHYCGDGVVDDGETCDGIDVQSCATATGQRTATGVIGCTDACTYDLRGCSYCGDGRVDGNEACDPAGPPLGACSTVIPGARGDLTCSAYCQISTTACDPPVFGDRRGLQPGAPWPLVAQTPSRQARGVANAGPTIGHTAWTYRGTELMHSPVIAADGTVYVFDSAGVLHAIDPANGARRWAQAKARRSNDSDGSSAVIANGFIYTPGDVLRANRLDTGAEVQRRPTGGEYRHLNVGGDGTIYAIGAAGLLALDPLNLSATPRWTAPLDQPGRTTAIAPDGTLYLCNVDHRPDGTLHPELRAIDPTDGSDRWPPIALAASCDTPSIGVDGAVFVIDWDHVIHAFEPDGMTRWTSDRFEDFVGGFDSVPAIGGDGTVYVVARFRGLLALDPADGHERWAARAVGDGLAGIAVGGDGVIYVTTWGPGGVTAFAPLGVELWSWSLPPGRGGCFSSPGIGADGTVYVGCEDFSVVAFPP